MQETQETQARSLGQEDPLGKEVAPHSSILACRISWTGEPGGAAVHGVAKESDTTEHTQHGIVLFALTVSTCLGKVEYLPLGGKELFISSEL